MRLTMLALMFTILPSDASEFVEISRAAGLSFGREATTGYFQMQRDGEPLAISMDARLNFHLQAAFEFSGQPYIVVYDTAANVPSGRRLSRGAEGNDVYRVSIGSNGSVFDKVATLPVGIDIRVETQSIDGTFLVCGTTACLKLSNGWLGSISFESMDIPAGHEILEMAGRFLLLQKSYNDQFDEAPGPHESIFFICRVSTFIGECAPVPPDVIPYDLKADGSYTRATDPEAVLRFDYDRLGVADYRQSNLEARIAWSCVYYLSGLAALYQMPIEDAFKADVKARLTREVEALADLVATPYPGLQSRRYSLDRESVTFLLHVARVARTIELSRPVIGNDLADRVLGPLLAELRRPQRTVEMVSLSPRAEVRYRPLMPFWADGSNVPWNYQNAWIEAVILTGTPPELRGPIAQMVETFTVEEGLADHPDKWSYAGGTFNAGWTDGVSTNTPVYAGQSALNVMAHISYRSMDALAMLAAQQEGMDVIPDFDQYAADLVSRGYLYPLVNQGLVEPAPIPFVVARHFARSSLPWQFQNQVWAIASMMGSW